MISAKKRVFWRAVQPFIGSVIGVGIFGLPYVFSQSGFAIGATWLVALALVYMLVLAAYSEVIVTTRGKHHLAGLTKKYLGKHWTWAAFITIAASSWGALLAYLILGGGFLHALISPLLGGSVFTYQIIFYTICSLLLIGGLGFIVRLEGIFVALLFILLALILTGSTPHIDLTNLTSITTDHWFTPFGVVIFALGGAAVVPEMAQVLGRQKRLLPRAIITGVAIVSVVYLIFTGIIVAVSGAGTTQDAITGLGAVVGEWVLLIGSLIGLFSVFTSFLILGMSFMDMLTIDYKRRYMTSWAVVISVPMALFLLNIREFIEVVGFVGGVFGGCASLLIIATYLSAKKHATTTKRAFKVPSWTMYACALVFITGIIMMIVT